MDILQMSVQAGMLIAVVILIRSLTLYRLPKVSFLILWGMVLLRMLVPFSVSTKWSIYNLFSVLPGDPRAGVMQDAGTLAGGKSAPWSGSVPGQPGNTVSRGEGIFSSPLVLLWLCGMAVLAAVFAVLLIRSYRVLKSARPMVHPLMDKWLGEHGTIRSLRIMRSALATSPLSMGILRPCIIFPERMDMENEGLVRHVLVHEYIHVRRFDMLWKMLALCAVCVHWFNPMAWVMLFLMNRDLELACDEMVLRYFGQEDRADYAGSLIDIAERNRAFSLIHNYFGKNIMEERIISIMKYKKTSILSLVSACIIIAGTGLAFATSAQAGGSGLSPEEQDRITNAAEDSMESDFTMMSYVNPQDGRTYYSMDGGETFEAMTEEEYEQRFPTLDVEWWTYEEYKAWLETEKEQLQSMIGESGWTGGRGDFVWTQEIVDETIALYEEILQDIKNGMQVSKNIDGEPDMMMMYNPADIAMGITEYSEAEVIAGDKQ